MLWLKVHSHLLLRACLLGSKRKLPPQACQIRPGPLPWSTIQGACSSLAQCTAVVRVICHALEPTALLVHPVLAAIAEDAVAAYSSATAHRNSPELCRRSSPIAQNMIFVFPAFTFSPSSPLLLSKSRASGHIPQEIQQ